MRRLLLSILTLATLYNTGFCVSPAEFIRSNFDVLLSIILSMVCFAALHPAAKALNNDKSYNIIIPLLISALVFAASLNSSIGSQVYNLIFPINYTALILIPSFLLAVYLVYGSLKTKAVIVSILFLLVLQLQSYS